MAAAGPCDHAELISLALDAIGEMEYPAAVKWYMQAAEAGSAIGAMSAAAMFETGMGIPPDRGRAVKFYRQAARAGLPGAIEKLEDIYKKDLILLACEAVGLIAFGGMPAVWVFQTTNDTARWILIFIASVFFIAGLATVAEIGGRVVQLVFLKRGWSAEDDRAPKIVQAKRRIFRAIAQAVHAAGVAWRAMGWILAAGVAVAMLLYPIIATGIVVRIVLAVFVDLFGFQPGPTHGSVVPLTILFSLVIVVGTFGVLLDAEKKGELLAAMWGAAAAGGLCALLVGLAGAQGVNTPAGQACVTILLTTGSTALVAWCWCHGRRARERARTKEDGMARL